MSFTNRYNFLPLFFFTFFSLSCSTSSLSIVALNFTPELAQKTFHRNSIRLEKKAINSPNDSKALYNASKNLTMYTYGFLMDEAKKNNSPLPITKIIDEYYAEVQKMGGQRWDTSSLIKRFRK